MISHFTEDKLIDYLSCNFFQHNLAHAFIIAEENNADKKHIIYHFLQKISPDLVNLASRVAMGSFSDLLTIEKNDKNEITISEIRKIIHFCSLSPIEASCKVIIINQAELLNTNASNALLKILEEPPGNSTFFLLTNQPQQLLPTIRSRCQLLRVKKSNLAPVEIPKNEFYEKILAILVNNDFIKFEKFTEQYLVKNQDVSVWLEIKDAVSDIFFDIIKLSIDNIKQSKQDALIDLFNKNADIIFWLDLSREWEEAINNIELINIDKKQALWHVFNKIKG